MAFTDEPGPYARWAYRDMTFLRPDTDTPVEHEFQGVDVDRIRFVPLQVEGDAYVYQAKGTRNANTATTVWLRASAPCRARILLAVEHP